VALGALSPSTEVIWDKAEIKRLVGEFEDYVTGQKGRRELPENRVTEEPRRTVQVELSRLLEAFAEGTTAQQQDAILAIIKARALHRAAKQPGFQAGLSKLAQVVRETGNDLERLHAMAIFGQVANIVRNSRQRLGAILKEGFSTVLPPLDLLPHPDQRFYVASGWRFAPADWWGGYLAASAVHEDSAERVRAECIEGLLALSGSLETALDQVRQLLGTVRFDTRAPGDSMARRLRRLLSAFRASPPLQNMEPGADAGNRVAHLLRDAFRATGFPSEPAAREELADEAISLVHQLMQLRFSLSTVPETYGALDIARDWFRATEWHKYAEQSVAARKVEKDIVEALRLLVRAGITDDALFRRLSTAAGSDEVARAALKDIADESPGLAVEVRSWLLGIAPPEKSSLAEESQHRIVDQIVADLLIDAGRLCEGRDVVKTEVLPEISVVAPRMVNALRSWVALTEDVLNNIQLAADRRSLQIVGRAGDETDFSPLEHEMVGGWQAGVRRVRILRPLVQSQPPGQMPRIVRKALVEPVKTQH